jgi:two-component system, OmpR family, response regulator
MNQPERILVVEDDEGILEILDITLADLGGYAVDRCTSGAEALEHAAAHAPDFILLDVMMPDMDGSATLQALRAIPSLVRTPVVFLTAQKREALPYDIADPYTLGVIEKPFQPRALLARLAEFWQIQPVELAVDIDPERVRAVQRHYLSTLSIRLKHIDALWTKGTRAALALIQQQAHQMGGSGATLGFVSLGEAARQLEAALAALRQVDPIDGLPAAGLARAQNALDQLREAIQISMAAPPV